MTQFSYDNVTLVSDVISDLEHRAIDADTSEEFCGKKLKVPIIASPMADVCNGRMANALLSAGGMGIIHRFQFPSEQVKEYKNAVLAPTPLDLELHGMGLLASKEESFYKKGVACAIGVTGDYRHRFDVLYDAGCRIFCLDTANGANKQVEHAIDYIDRSGHRAKVFIIAGNVATATGYLWLDGLNVDAVRVGIAGGSVCETKTETGVYLPTLESVRRCKNVQRANSPLIIADGGIRIPADMCKALAVGADAVMCGSVLAGTKEAPGEPFNEDGVLWKVYRGSASFGVQKFINDDEPDYIEGRETRVRYKRGGVAKIVRRFQAGLQSSMSYMNARTLFEYRCNVHVELL